MEPKPNEGNDVGKQFKIPYINPDSFTRDRPQFDNSIKGIFGELGRAIVNNQEATFNVAHLNPLDADTKTQKKDKEDQKKRILDEKQRYERDKLIAYTLIQQNLSPESKGRAMRHANYKKATGKLPAFKENPILLWSIIVETHVANGSTTAVQISQEYTKWDEIKQKLGQRVET